MQHQTQRTSEGIRGILSFGTDGEWIPENLREEVELFAAMPPVENEFTPNIVVTVNPYAGSIQDFCRLALEGLGDSLKETRIVDVSAWAFSFTAPDSEGNVPVDALGEPLPAHVGRVIEYTHRAPNGRTVSGVDYLVLLDGWAVQVSTTTAIQTRMLFDDDFVRMARSVTALRAPGAADVVAPVGIPQSVQVDAVATVRLGHEAEDVTHYRTSGANIGSGTWISGEAIARIPQLKDVVLGRLERNGNDAVLNELTELGVLENGRLGDIGAFMAAALDEASARLRLTGRFLDRETLFQAFALGDHVLVLAGPGYGQAILNQPWQAPSRTAVLMQILPLSELTSAASRWAGAGPAWNIHVAPFMFEKEAIGLRFEGEAPLPAGADPVLEQVWNQPWFIWRLEAEGPRGPVDATTYVNAGPRGNYRIGMVDEPGTGREKTALWAVDSSFIFRQLEDVLQAAYFGRETRLA